MPVYHIGKPQSPYSRPHLERSSPRNMMILHPTSPHPLTRSTVLFTLKEGVTQAQIDDWSTTAKGMVGKIPGRLLPELEHILAPGALSQDTNQCVMTK